MKQAFLIVDLGGNSRVALVGTDGTLLAVRKKRSEYFPDNDFSPHGTSFDAEKYKEIVFRFTREIIEEAGDVEIIAVSSTSQRQGIVLIGKDGSSLVGYPNLDSRGAEFYDQIQWDRIKELSMLDPHPILSMVKFLGTTKRQKEVAEKTRYVTSISDWVGYLFTGKVVWEHSHAIHSAVYDIYQSKWAEELCDCIGVSREVLPPLARAGDIMGPILPEVSAITGIPDSAVFIVGGADTQLAIEGAQAEPGDVVIVNGTTTPIVTPVTSLVESPFWLSTHVRENEYMLEVNIGASGSNLDTLVRQLSPAKSLSAIEEEALGKGLPSCTAVFATDMQIPRKTLSHGAFLIDNPLRDIRECDYIHAMILNIGFHIKTGLDILLEHIPIAGGKLIGTGGGFRGSICAQAVADVTGIDLYIYENFDQATIVGCIRFCCEAMNIPPPKRVLKQIFKPSPSDQFIAYHENWLKYRKTLQDAQGF